MRSSSALIACSAASARAIVFIATLVLLSGACFDRPSRASTLSSSAVRIPTDVCSASAEISSARGAEMRATDRIEIGRTGLFVTRLGLGGVALSGFPPSTDPHRPSPESEAVSLIGRSLALGLNYLDTAPMYGVGESERRYGQALRGVPRDRYVLSTKVGRVLQPDPSGTGKMAWSSTGSAWWRADPTTAGS